MFGLSTFYCYCCMFSIDNYGGIDCDTFDWILAKSDAAFRKPCPKRPAD